MLDSPPILAWSVALGGRAMAQRMNTNRVVLLFDTDVNIFESMEEGSDGDLCMESKDEL